MSRVAGHHFDLSSGRCSCGRRFSDIAGTAASDVGAAGIAHAANLTTEEYREIVTERERIWALVAGAASGIIVTPPDSEDPPPTEDVLVE